MARVTPQEAAEKWARRASQASQDYVSGVRRVQTAPGQLAAAKKDKALANYTDAMNSGRWAQRVASVSLGDWQQKAADLGGSRYASGVAAAQPKMASAMERVLRNVDSVKAKIAGMPDTTLEDRINRSVAFQRGMAATKGK